MRACDRHHKIDGTFHGAQDFQVYMGRSRGLESTWDLCSDCLWRFRRFMDGEEGKVLGISDLSTYICTEEQAGSDETPCGRTFYFNEQGVDIPLLTCPFCEGKAYRQDPPTGDFPATEDDD